MPTTTEITSLAQIRERKEEVRKELNASKMAAAKQLSTTATDAKAFVLQDVILPAVGIAVGAYVLTKVVQAAFQSSPDNHNPPEAMDEEATTVTSSGVSNRAYASEPARQAKPSPTAKPLTASLLRLGHLLVPAGKAIFEVIQKERK